MSFLAALDQLNMRGPQIGRVGVYLFKPLEAGGVPRTCVFDSRAAYQRFIELVETSERVQTSFSMWFFRGAGTTYWFIRDGVLLGKWESYKTIYPPNLRIKEEAILYVADEWEAIRCCEERAREKGEESEDRDLGTALHPTNRNTSINLDFRPETYWPFRDPSPERDYTTLAPDPGPERTVVSLETAGITDLCGVSLPALAPGEVEIARLTYAMTAKRTVTSLCARMEGSSIRYRFVSDHTGPKGFKSPVSKSPRPLSMAEIVGLLDHAVERDSSRGEGLYFGALNHWAHDPKTSVPADELRGAIRVDSAFYPALGRWYDETFETWCERERIEHGATDTRGHHAAPSETKADSDRGATQE